MHRPTVVEIGASSPSESLLAEKLWVAGFRCTRFEVLGGLVIILRETADHAF
jgi:hypothetical protein